MSDKKKDGGSAFPLYEPGIDSRFAPRINLGMSLRDYFAPKALSLTCVRVETIEDIADAAELAYAIADAILKERAK